MRVKLVIIKLYILFESNHLTIMVSKKKYVEIERENTKIKVVKKYKFSEKTAGCKVNKKIAENVPCQFKYVSLTCEMLA